ncbi:MAG: amino acid permease [Deltaproteobacteria bacterium]|nr:amino acid permease [Deltaproteobacteria bacterium]MBN2671979.1 amino acid permease [Deltaproteobacteria bacterium]
MNQERYKNVLRDATGVKFKQNTGLFGATTLGVGALLGAGVYVLIGLAASAAGPGLWLAYVLCGVLTFLTVMVYSDFARRESVSGGGYYYAYSQLGSFWGFIVGWHLAVGSIFACALYAYGFASYASSLISDTIAAGWVIRLVASLAVISLVLMGLRGSKGGDWLGRIFTWANVAVLLAIVAMGVVQFDRSHFTPAFPNGIGGVGAAISLIYISFFGFQLVANNSEEIRNSKRIVPLAMKLSLLIAFLIYLLVALASVGAVGAQSLGASEVPLVLVASGSLGRAGVLFIALGGVLASAAALNSTLISQSRQLFAMGRDGMLPKLIGAVTKRSRVPAAAMVAGGGATVTVSVLADVSFIAESANFAILFAMLPVCVALHRLYVTSTEEVPRWKRAVPFAALVANGGLLATLDMHALMFGIGLFGVGCGVFLVYSRTAEERMRAGISISLDEKQNYFSLLSGANRILVPVGNPETIEPLFNISKTLLPPHRGELIALRIAKTAEGTNPRMQLRNQELEQPEIDAVERMMRLAESCDIGIRPLLRATNNPSQGIRHVALEENCSLIVMGWTASAESTPSRFLVDVVTKSKTDFVFLHLRETRPFMRIGVALGGRDNLAIMVKIATMLAEESGGNVTYFTILPEHFSAQELRHSKVLQREAIWHHTGLATYTTELQQTDYPLDAIVSKSKELDLLLIGSAPLQNMESDSLIGSFSSMVIERSKCSTIVVRRTLGFGRFIPAKIADMFTFEKQ